MHSKVLMSLLKYVTHNYIHLCFVLQLFRRLQGVRKYSNNNNVLHAPWNFIRSSHSFICIANLLHFYGRFPFIMSWFWSGVHKTHLIYDVPYVPCTNNVACALIKKRCEEVAVVPLLRHK